MQLDNKQIGKRIKQQRQFLGYTREEFSEKIDISTKFLTDIEYGIKGMSIQTLYNISEVLMVSTDFILSGNHPEKPDETIIEMLKKCPQEKQEYAADILKIFVKSLSSF